MKIILYPPGGGGHWLSYILWMLENNCVDFNRPKVNFHKQPACRNFLIVSGLKVNQNQHYDFSSQYTFNAYLNFYVKKRVAENFQKFNQWNFLEQFRELSNDARYRMGDTFLKDYNRHVDLDYKNIFLNSTEFKNQLNLVLSQNNFDKLADQEFIDGSIEIFKPTAINPIDYLGDYTSVAWLAWCHSICLAFGINTDAVNFEDKNNAESFLQQHHDFFIEKSLPYVLYH